jgi:hypothetical protein
MLRREGQQLQQVCRPLAERVRSELLVIEQHLEPSEEGDVQCDASEYSE